MAESPSTQVRKVLLVDDNEDLLPIAAGLFASLGYDVVTATRGDEALAILQDTDDIGLLFSDVVMPGLDGVQLGHAARKLYPNIRVVLVSGFANVPTGPSSVHAFDFLPKPYRLSDITRLLGIDAGL